MMEKNEYENETVRRALAGDHEAGREALVLCLIGLINGKLSETMAFYLADRLSQILDDMKPDRALCIAKPPHKPSNPFPEWKQELGALAAVLAKRGYQPAQIVRALCDARAIVADKPIDEKDAYRIKKEWGPMRDLDDTMLKTMLGGYWEILTDYPPLK
jgi:hypothetical protein